MIGPDGNFVKRPENINPTVSLESRVEALEKRLKLLERFVGRGLNLPRGGISIAGTSDPETQARNG